MKKEISAKEFSRQWISGRSLVLRKISDKKQKFRCIFPLFSLIMILSRCKILKKVTRNLLIFENRLFIATYIFRRQEYKYHVLVDGVHSDCTEYIMGNYHDDCRFYDDVYAKLNELIEIRRNVPNMKGI